MQKVKLGFVPAHRVPFDEQWAIDMRARCLKAMAAIPDVEFVVPDETLTQGGVVRNDTDADKVTELFRREGVQGIVIGAMTFGDEVAAVAVAQNLPGLPVLLFGTKEGDFLPGGGAAQTRSWYAFHPSGLYHSASFFIDLFPEPLFAGAEPFRRYLQYRLLPGSPRRPGGAAAGAVETPGRWRSSSFRQRVVR